MFFKALLLLDEQAVMDKMLFAWIERTHLDESYMCLGIGEPIT